MNNASPHIRLSPRTLWIGCILFVLAVLIVVTLSSPPLERGHHLSAQQAPKIGFQFPDGTAAALDDFKGKVILLHFWASWCLPCIDEMPELGELEAKLKAENFVILAIAVDDNFNTARRTLPLDRFPSHLIFKYDSDLTDKYPVSAIPTSFLIDSEGIIREQWIGPQNWLGSTFLDTINNYLKKQSKSSI